MGTSRCCPRPRKMAPPGFRQGGANAEKSVEVEPLSAMLSKLYWCEGRSLAALAQAEVAVAFEFHGVEAWLDLGQVLCTTWKRAADPAIECLETGVAHRLPSASVSRNFAEALLLLGDYAAGWREYPEAKYQVMKARLGGAVPYMQPLLARREWDGTPIRGRLILQVDSGFGDWFHVCALGAPVARTDLCARAACGAGSCPLPRDPVKSGKDVEGKRKIPASSRHTGAAHDRLPHLFGVQRPEDVACAPYLRATTELPPLPGTFRVGLRWAGDPHSTRPTTAARPRWPAWGPVLEMADITLYSLQLGKPADGAG